MTAVPGYKNVEVIYQGLRVTVYRAVRSADEAAVILKRLERPRDGSSDVTRFRREYEIARRLDAPGIVRVLDLETTRQGLLLVMSDTGGASVATLRRIQPLSSIEALHIGVAVAEALDRIHAGHVIHKDVNPANIVWNRAGGTVQLIDFSIATELARETSPSDIEQLEGTLAYIAPEQTGRMNRSLDWRCDFYALGATLYDLLIGHPPFDGDDALAVIHGHSMRNFPDSDVLRQLS
ncbi:MAG: serine/threonine-protein kinase, partial [Rhodospirillaceae bacterium]